MIFKTLRRIAFPFICLALAAAMLSGCGQYTPGEHETIDMGGQGTEQPDNPGEDPGNQNPDTPGEGQEPETPEGAYFNTSLIIADGVADSDKRYYTYTGELNSTRVIVNDVPGNAIIFIDNAEDNLLAGNSYRLIVTDNGTSPVSETGFTTTWGLLRFTGELNPFFENKIIDIANNQAAFTLTENYLYLYSVVGDEKTTYDLDITVTLIKFSEDDLPAENPEEKPDDGQDPTEPDDGEPDDQEPENPGEDQEPETPDGTYVNTSLIIADGVADSDKRYYNYSGELNSMHVIANNVPGNAIIFIDNPEENLVAGSTYQLIITDNGTTPSDNVGFTAMWGLFRFTGSLNPFVELKEIELSNGQAAFTLTEDYLYLCCAVGDENTTYNLDFTISLVKLNNEA